MVSPNHLEVFGMGRNKSEPVAKKKKSLTLQEALVSCRGFISIDETSIFRV